MIARIFIEYCFKLRNKINLPLLQGVLNFMSVSKCTGKACAKSWTMDWTMDWRWTMDDFYLATAVSTNPVSKFSLRLHFVTVDTILSI